MSTAGRLREVTIPISTQHLLDHTWNIVPVFGSPNTRKMLINLEMFRRLEHVIYEEFKATEMELGVEKCRE